MPKLLKYRLALFLCALPLPALAVPATLLGGNNLGMHCIDSDYSVFSVLPPYNTIECQLIVNGLLLKSGSGYAVTCEAVADPAGSFNSTSIGKGNYTTFVQALYGAAVTPDHGLAGWNVPGPGNAPQSMLFENTNLPAPGVAAPVNWFRAEGIPISPYDDAGRKNPYPMMRLVAVSEENLIGPRMAGITRMAGSQFGALPARWFLALPRKLYLLTVRKHPPTKRGHRWQLDRVNFCPAFQERFA